MTYETAPFICPTARAPGFHDVLARITWTPREGASVTVTGEYLDADGPAGLITLGCGIDGAAADLGLDGWVFSRGDDYLELLCELVDKQLERGPSARLCCPEGVLGIELVPWAEGAP